MYICLKISNYGNYIFQVEPSPITDITFIKPKRGQEKPVVVRAPATVPTIPETTDKQFADFCDALHEANPSTRVLTTVKKFVPATPAIQPVSQGDELPEHLPDLLFDAKYKTFKAPDLIKEAAKLLTSMTAVPEQLAYLETITRKQADSEMWHKYRNGLITASISHAALRTNSNRPAPSLIKSVCGYGSFMGNYHTQWGKDNERTAVEAYATEQKKKHANFSLRQSGLIIHQDHPFLGASPDGIVSCDCCGQGILEVKCPSKHRDLHPKDISSREKDFCLDGTQLKHSHPYFSQVQFQMAVAKMAYCDFVVWTTKGQEIQRVLPVSDYLLSNINHLRKIYVNNIMPELMTRRMKEKGEEPSTILSDSTNVDLYCYCRKPDDGSQMIACEEEGCKYEWFHLTCLKLVRVPRGAYICKECKKKRKKVKAV